MYALPFAQGTFDTVTMVRVIHHAQDAPQVIQNINAIVSPGGTFVLEFANKRNVKAIMRWLLKRQRWNPFHLQPYEFVELNFDFHPHWMQRRLQEAGFTIQTRRSVSHFRLDVLKRLVPTRWLVKLDSLAQPTGRWWQLTPSTFVQNQASRSKPPAAKGAFFRCPICHSTDMPAQRDVLTCQGCRRRWPISDGLYDFKEPL